MGGVDWSLGRGTVSGLRLLYGLGLEFGLETRSLSSISPDAVSFWASALDPNLVMGA